MMKGWKGYGLIVQRGRCDNMLIDGLEESLAGISSSSLSDFPLSELEIDFAG